MDEIAEIYLHYAHGKYRIKVFEKSIGIERQFPREDNVMFDRTRYSNLYNDSDGSWNMILLNLVINNYETYIADVNAKLDAESN